MLHYEDGRFATAKMFSFFALNYIIRHRNASSSNWFVSDFNKDCPETLEELHERIARGDTTFVNNINYYNGRVKGSSPYWQKKRQEVYSWINHHIQEGHGAPTYFITLSCAEYFWPDVMRLIQERMILGGMKASEAKNLCNPTSKKFVQVINDYSIVIQEYFQERTELWLKTVGKELFGIEHYWVRYEFAPGRGQIHAHLLAIPKEQHIFKLCYEETKKEGNEEIRAAMMSEWSKKKFGLTVMVGPDFDNLEVKKENCPSMICFMDVPVNAFARGQDEQRLMKHLQVHGCSNFCLRKDKHGKWYVNYASQICE